MCEFFIKLCELFIKLCELFTLSSISSINDCSMSPLSSFTVFFVERFYSDPRTIHIMVSRFTTFCHVLSVKG